MFFSVSIFCREILSCSSLREHRRSSFSDSKVSIYKLSRLILIHLPCLSPAPPAPVFSVCHGAPPPPVWRRRPCQCPPPQSWRHRRHPDSHCGHCLETEREIDLRKVHLIIPALLDINLVFTLQTLNKKRCNSKRLRAHVWIVAEQNLGIFPTGLLIRLRTILKIFLGVTLRL